MKAKTWLRCALVMTLAAAGCTSPQPAGETHRVFSHPRAIANPLLPLGSLRQDILESNTERVERTVKPEVQKTFTIDGQTVQALAVEDREFADGKLSEVTLDYFAQDDDGNVYYLGEDVDEYKDGAVSGHGGAWLLGKDTQIAGVILPANPKVGDKFMPENVPHITWERDEVVSVSETVVVPAGTFVNCVKVREHTSDGSTEFKCYAPGVGCVEEADSDGVLILKSHTNQP